MAGQQSEKGAKVATGILFLVVTIAAAWRFRGLQVYLHLPIGVAALVGLSLVYVLGLLWLFWFMWIRSTDFKPRRFAAVLFILLLWPSSYAGRQAGEYFMLVHFYGRERVRDEKLQIVRGGKFEPWRVMSGTTVVDRIPDHEYWQDMGNIIGWTMLLTCFLIGYRFLPRRQGDRWNFTFSPRRGVLYSFRFETMKREEPGRDPPAS